MNARQRRKYSRRVWGDHHRWPLGTVVVVKPGHCSPAAVGMRGTVSKHGYPCTHKVDCIVDFPVIVEDLTAGGARYGHYVKFKHLRWASNAS